MDVRVLAERERVISALAGIACNDDLPAEDRVQAGAVMLGETRGPASVQDLDAAVERVGGQLLERLGLGPGAGKPFWTDTETGPRGKPVTREMLEAAKQQRQVGDE